MAAVVGPAIALQWLSTFAAVAWSHADERVHDPLVLLNVSVLGPLALTAALVIAWRLGGRSAAIWMSVVWLASPWLLVSFALPAYDSTARDQMLPLVLGLAPERGFAAGTAVLAAAALLLSRGVAPAAAAGMALGFAALLVPATLAFAVAATVALLVEWRPSSAAALGAAPLPFLAALVLWRGGSPVERSYDALVASLDGFREYFWSKRVLEWLPFAGALGLGRRSIVLALVLGGGFIGFAVVQLARVDSAFADASVFRLLLAGLPSYVVLTAALPLLVPSLAARLAARTA